MSIADMAAITIPVELATSRSGRPLPPEPVSLRAVALPAEHGGWGLLVEPLALGLVLAPSGAGWAIALACVAAFLLHHPLKLVLSDLRRRARFPRTTLAVRMAGAYALAAAVGLVLAAAFAEGPFWPPLLMAAPVAAVQLAYGALNRGRMLAAELAGTAALAASAPAILLATGWATADAVLIWALLAARGAGSILYIRARLKRDRGLGGSAAGPLAVQLVTAGAVAGLAWLGYAPWLAAGAFMLLLARAGWGLSPWHAVARPRTVGFQELGYGAATTVLIAAGFLLC